MILRFFLITLFTFSFELIPEELEHSKLNENVNLLKKELQKRKYLLQLKKYHFLLLNKQRIQFILVKQGRMFSTGIGIASDEHNSGYKISIYELFDFKDYESKELIGTFAVSDKIFLREIHDTSLYYLIEIEMTGTDSANGSVVELVHGFSSLQLKAINKNIDTSETDVGRCNFGNCGIVHRVDWGKK
jgi:hypothetical protein